MPRCDATKNHKHRTDQCVTNCKKEKLLDDGNNSHSTGSIMKEVWINTVTRYKQT